MSDHRLYILSSEEKYLCVGTEVIKEPGIDQAIEILKQAARTGAVPSSQVCRALVQVEKVKLAVSKSLEWLFTDPMEPSQGRSSSSGTCALYHG